MKVGNGEQRNCADPAHNHTIHGGSFWAEAFYSILKDVRTEVHTPSMFMTEGASTLLTLATLLVTVPTIGAYSLALL